ncbi:MAG: hypothetical protein KDN22_20935 [Verrucomicrobiae bacterium]|nr:hypothetical protein [Verrucomicrobiae bacterium]
MNKKLSLKERITLARKTASNLSSPSSSDFNHLSDIEVAERIEGTKTVSFLKNDNLSESGEFYKKVSEAAKKEANPLIKLANKQKKS